MFALSVTISLDSKILTVLPLITYNIHKLFECFFVIRICFMFFFME